MHPAGMHAVMGPRHVTFRILEGVFTWQAPENQQDQPCTTEVQEYKGDDGSEPGCSCRQQDILLRFAILKSS